MTLLSWFRSRRCQHRWTPRSVHHRCGWEWYTLVLQVCTVCGNPRTIRVDGVWTIEDIAVATDNDLGVLTVRSQDGQERPL